MKCGRKGQDKSNPKENNEFKHVHADRKKGEHTGKREKERPAYQDLQHHLII